MTFFTQAKEDRTIETRTLMSERELKNAIIARIMESNAWEMHKNRHKDAELSPIGEDKELSEFEKRVIKNPEKHHEDGPKINYNSGSKTFSVSCNCGKEKFIFDMKSDSVRSEDPNLKMKELDPYRKNNNSEQQYGREKDRSDNDNNYNNNPARQPSLSYNNSSGGMTYKN
jgi:hypothetical protein